MEALAVIAATVGSVGVGVAVHDLLRAWGARARFPELTDTQLVGMRAREAMLARTYAVDNVHGLIPEVRRRIRRLDREIARRGLTEQQEPPK